MKSIDLDHAIARTAHKIAGCVHVLLYEAGMTVDELKAKLRKFPDPMDVQIVDFVLSATNSDKVRMRDLTDIAWALGGEWDFQITRWPDEPDATLFAEERGT